MLHTFSQCSILSYKLFDDYFIDSKFEALDGRFLLPTPSQVAWVPPPPRRLQQDDAGRANWKVVSGGCAQECRGHWLINMVSKGPTSVFLDFLVQGGS